MKKLVSITAVLLALVAMAGLALAQPGGFKAPQVLSAAELAALIASQPDMVDVVDVRPAEEFAEYSVPGSVNVEPDKLMNSAVYFTGPGTLVIVDKDGQTAMTLAGALAMKNKRDIKVLGGGAAGYWRQSEFEPIIKEVPLPAKASPAAAPASGVQEAPASGGQAPAAAPGSAPQPPTSKNAGC